jgi:sulfur carrier protein ThiS
MTKQQAERASVWVNDTPIAVDDSGIGLLHAASRSGVNVEEGLPGAAIAINGRFVARAQWADRVLYAGDRVDVVEPGA